MSSIPPSYRQPCFAQPLDDAFEIGVCLVGENAATVLERIRRVEAKRFVPVRTGLFRMPQMAVGSSQQDARGVGVRIPNDSSLQSGNRVLILPEPEMNLAENVQEHVGIMRVETHSALQRLKRFP